MDQAREEELNITDYTELLNGKVAGLSLAFSIFVATSQSKEITESFVKSLSYAETTIKKKVENDEFQFKSKGYTDGTLLVLREMINSLTVSDADEKE